MQCLDREASNIISRRCDLFRWSAVFQRVAVVVDFHWFTDCHLEAIFITWTRRDFNFNRRRERCSSDHWRFSLNPAQHDILPHRQSQMSDLTIRLHITTSLKSISQKRWLYHLIFKWSFWPVQFNSSIYQPMSHDQLFFVLIGQNRLQLMSVMIIHKYVNIQASVVGPQ